jgi:peptidoglycan/xylan/chitin deacetylase (PgdA/CDA1 family)
MLDVTLTFDNGPEPDVTPSVLDTLRRHDVASTFFVIGEKLQRPGRRALAERAAAEGHWIGNHSYTHTVPLGDCRDPGIPEAEIGRTQAQLGALSHLLRLFRPFGGGGKLGRHLLSPEAAAFLRDGKYSCVLWNAVPHDWDDPEGWVETALAQCRALPWALVVLHDLPTGAMSHLGSFIERARAEGARFRQEFPPDCIAIDRGQETPRLAGTVAQRTS